MELLVTIKIIQILNSHLLKETRHSFGTTGDHQVRRPGNAIGRTSRLHSEGACPWLLISFAAVFAACSLACTIGQSVSGVRAAQVGQDSRRLAEAASPELSESGPGHRLVVTTGKYDAIELQEENERMGESP